MSRHGKFGISEPKNLKQFAKWYNFQIIQWYAGPILPGMYVFMNRDSLGKQMLGARQTQNWIAFQSLFCRNMKHDCCNDTS